MGTSQDFAVAVGGGRDPRTSRNPPLRAYADAGDPRTTRTNPTPWRSATRCTTSLVYFGLAEDRDAYEEEPSDAREPERDLEERYRERPNVRRLSTRRRRDEIDDIFADDSPTERRTTGCAPSSAAAANGRGGSCASTS